MKNYDGVNQQEVEVLPPKKFCKICGAESESTAHFCGNCGWSFDEDLENFSETFPEIIPETIPQPVVKPMKRKTPKKISNPIQQQNFQNNNFSANEIVCPNCGSKNFKSCQMIYNSGTRTRSFSSSTGYQSYGSNSSILAQNTAPPFQKKTYWIYSIVLISLAFFREASSMVLPLIAAVIIFIATIKELSHSRSKKGFEFIFIAPIFVFGFLAALIKENIFIQNLISDISFIAGIILFTKTFYNSYWNHNKYHKLYNEWLNTFVCSRCGTFFTNNRNY